MSHFSDSCGCDKSAVSVCCEVSECAYNNKRKGCTASMIEVSPDESSTRTFCATYRKD